MTQLNVKKRYRIQKNEQFRAIRSQGRSYSNELVVVCALKNSLTYSRFGFSVSRRVGNAVVRNRIKRRLREVMRLRMNQVQPGWDLVFIARYPIRNATYQQIDAACARLLRRAHLLKADAAPSDAKNTENADGTGGSS